MRGGGTGRYCLLDVTRVWCSFFLFHTRCARIVCAQSWKKGFRRVTTTTPPGRERGFSCFRIAVKITYAHTCKYTCIMYKLEKGLIINFKMLFFFSLFLFLLYIRGVHGVFYYTEFVTNGIYKTPLSVNTHAFILWYVQVHTCRRRILL